MQKTITSLENIDGFTADYWAVYFDNGIAFDYRQHLIAILVKKHISLYHISQIREWQLQSTPTRDPHGNIKGEHNFRIWLRIRDINCPEVSLQLSNAEQYYKVEEAMLSMKDVYDSKAILHDPCTPTAVILTAIAPEIYAIMKHLEKVEEENVKGTVFFVGIFEGNFNPWRIAVAEIGAGNSMASNISERAFQHFNPQVALFVGVAGGIKDVRLGDVVAATKVYAYESGKETDGMFKPRPDLDWSSYEMDQRARATRTMGIWRERLKLPHDSEPAAYIGPIAAGEKVIAATRSQAMKRIRQIYSDALAVEMEGRGFFNALHTNKHVVGIVVRGISDLLDDKSESDAQGWQEIASDSAAAFALELLASYPLQAGSN